MSKLNDKCVYSHIDPRTDIPMYVGSGSVKRASKIYRGTRSELYLKWFDDLSKVGYFPTINIIEKDLSKEDARLLEIKITKEYISKGFCTLNINIGTKFSENRKASFSGAGNHRFGKPAHNRGVKISKELSLKLSKIRTGVKRKSKQKSKYPINVIDKKTNESVIFNSISDCANHINCNESTLRNHIRRESSLLNDRYIVRNIKTGELCQN